MGNARAVFGHGAIALVLLATIASGQTNEATLVDSSTEAAPADSGADTGQTGDDQSADEPAPAMFGVGDRVALGDWNVVVHAVTDPYDSNNDLLHPADGNRWIAIDAEVFNVGDEPREVTSLFCFDLQDDLNRNFGQQLFSGSTVGAPTGEVGPGASRRGTIVYEVPIDADGFRLNFKCELFSNGSATIVL